MAGEGFKIADAYVEIHAEIAERDIERAAVQAGQQAGRTIAQQSGQRITKDLRSAPGIAAAGADMGKTLGNALGDSAGKHAAASLGGVLNATQADLDGMGRTIGGHLGDGISEGAGARIRDAPGIVKGADEGGRRGGKSMLGGLLGSFTDGAGDLFGSVMKLGGEAGTKLATSIASKLPMLGEAAAGSMAVAGPVAAVLLPAAVVLGTAVAAALGGALVAGLGAGVIGAGIKGALMDADVQDAGKAFTAQLKSDFAEATEGFRQPVMDAMRFVGTSFRGLLPDLKSMFSTAAGYLQPLTVGLVGLVRNVMPGIQSALASAGPLFSVIGAGLQGIGADLGAVFAMLSDNGQEMAGGLAFAFGLVRYAILSFGLVLNGAIETFGFLMDLFVGFSDWLGDIGAKLAFLPGPLGAAGKALVAFNDSTKDGAAAWESWGSGASSAGSSAFGAGTATDSFNQKQLLLNSSMAAGIQQAGGLSAAFKVLNGTALSAREAESGFQAAVDNARKAIGRKVNAIDLGTERGRAYDQSLRQIVTATDAAAQATYDQTSATKGTAAAQAAATAKYAAGRAQLVQVARQMGLSKAAANAYADEIMQIPKSWKTNATAKTDKAEIDAYARAIGMIPSQKTTTLILRQIRQTAINMGGTPLDGNAKGGLIRGPGTGTSDSIVRRLSNREYVIRAAAVEAVGVAALDEINSLGGGRRSAAPARGPVPRQSTGRATDSGTSVTIQNLVITMPQVETLRDFELVAAAVMEAPQVKRARFAAQGRR